MNLRPGLMLALCVALAPVHAAESLTLVYDASTSDVSPAKVSNACPVTIAGITDMRNNKETIGVEYRPVLGGNPVPWVSAAIENLKAYGFAVQKGEKAAEGGILLDVALIRSYVWHGPMRLNGMVAMDASFVLPSGEKISRKYRASGSKTNMAGAVSEYMSTLNYAVNNMLAKLAVDLQQMCAGNLAAFKTVPAGFIKVDDGAKHTGSAK